MCVGGREDCEWEQGMEEEIGYMSYIIYIMIYICSFRRFYLLLSFLRVKNQSCKPLSALHN